MSCSLANRDLSDLIVQIVAAHVSSNPLWSHESPGLIEVVCRTPADRGTRRRLAHLAPQFPPLSLQHWTGSPRIGYALPAPARRQTCSLESAALRVRVRVVESATRVLSQGIEWYRGSSAYASNEALR